MYHHNDSIISNHYENTKLLPMRTLLDGGTDTTLCLLSVFLNIHHIEDTSVLVLPEHRLRSLLVARFSVCRHWSKIEDVASLLSPLPCDVSSSNPINSFNLCSLSLCCGKFPHPQHCTPAALAIISQLVPAGKHRSNCFMLAARITASHRIRFGSIDIRDSNEMTQYVRK